MVFIRRTLLSRPQAIEDNRLGPRRERARGSALLRPARGAARVLGVSTAVRDESRGATCLNAASARLRSEVGAG